MDNKKLFLYIFICLVLVLIGLAVYQTALNYQNLIKNKNQNQQNFATSTETEVENKPVITTGANGAKLVLALEGKTVLMVIAFNGFEDQEYAKVRQLMQMAGGRVKIASNNLGTAIGSGGVTVGVDMLLRDAIASDYDAIIYIGGAGALENLDNLDSYKLLQDGESVGSVLAGISVSPVILGNAGVLKGVMATVWRSAENISGPRSIEADGAVYKEEAVINFGDRIITANDTVSAETFGMTIIEALTRE
jgi:protease I